MNFPNYNAFVWLVGAAALMFTGIMMGLIINNNPSFIEPLFNALTALGTIGLLITAIISYQNWRNSIVEASKLDATKSIIRYLARAEVTIEFLLREYGQISLIKEKYIPDKYAAADLQSRSKDIQFYHDKLEGILIEICTEAFVIDAQLGDKVRHLISLLDGSKGHLRLFIDEVERTISHGPASSEVEILGDVRKVLDNLVRGTFPGNMNDIKNRIQDLHKGQRDGFR